VLALSPNCLETGVIPVGSTILSDESVPSARYRPMVAGLLSSAGLVGLQDRIGIKLNSADPID